MSRAKWPGILGTISAVAGALYGVISLMISDAPSYHRPEPLAAALGYLFVIGLPALVGGAIGGIAGFVIATCISKGHLSCPRCQYSWAVASHTSLIDGKQRPNSCPRCKHEWTKAELPVRPQERVVRGRGNVQFLDEDFWKKPGDQPRSEK